MSYRLLKFDIVHPASYLEKKKKEWTDLDDLSATEYRQRLISLRSNYSDFYTYYLNEMGWEAEEFFLMDDTYMNKLGKELFGLRYPFERRRSHFWNRLRPEKYGWPHKVIQAYIKEFKPDVLFVRSQPMSSRYWQKYRKDCLLVSRLSARLPRQWHPDDWDLIYTDLDMFKDFFEAHNVPSRLNKQGFDPRILDDLEQREPQHELTFVGGLGTYNFASRTHFFEQIASQTNFKWWGYWYQSSGSANMSDFPNLEATWHGPTSGVEMYQIYQDSKIVLNDYVDTSKDIGFNQRMFEVMGVGAFMLTRRASNFKEQFPADIFETFTSVENCLKKISQYLDDDVHRREIGENGRRYVHEHYHFREIAEEFHKDLMDLLN